VTVTPDAAGAALLPILWIGAVLLLLLAGLAACNPQLSLRSPYLSTAGSLLALALGGGLLITGSTLSASGGSVLGFVPFAIHYDGLSGAFLIAFGVSAAASSFSVVGAQPRSAAEGAVFPLFLASILLVLGASNAFSFLLAWESMALLSAFLVYGLHPTRTIISAGNVYLALTHVATAAILVGFAVLAGSTGGQLDFSAWHAGAPGLDPGARNVALVLVFVGFATKAGAMPFHTWLPRAHPVAPSHVSAVMSGIMIKTGIYGLIRIAIDVVGGAPDWLGLLILTIGAGSAVLGALYALMQQDLKRLLAFSSIENIGIILLGVGAAIVLESHGAHDLAALALAAAIFHSINHAVFKSLLFIGAGAVLHATGLRDMNHLGGLGRKMPITLLVFGIGAAAIAGLPPLNGFASEWLTFQALLGAAGNGIGLAGGAAVPAIRFAAAIAIGALALTVALAVAAFVKATGITFLGLPRSAAAGAAHEASRGERGAMAALAAACVVLGIAAGPVVKTLTTVAQTALHATVQAAPAFVPAVTVKPHSDGAAIYAAPFLALLLAAAVAAFVAMALFGRLRTSPRRVDTWTCGIAPKPAFQYTSTSYSQLVRKLFRRVLAPERTVQIEYYPGTSFPSSIRYRSRITMLLEERLLNPAHELSLRGANFARKVQGGAIQLYIAYSVAAVLLLLLWARWT
jgi:hydrogenase-4 component B